MSQSGVCIPKYYQSASWIIFSGNWPSDALVLVWNFCFLPYIFIEVMNGVLPLQLAVAPVLHKCVLTFLYECLAKLRMFEWFKLLVNLWIIFVKVIYLAGYVSSDWIYGGQNIMLRKQKTGLPDSIAFQCWRLQLKEIYQILLEFKEWKQMLGSLCFDKVDICEITFHLLLWKDPKWSDMWLILINILIM